MISFKPSLQTGVKTQAAEESLTVPQLCLALYCSKLATGRSGVTELERWTARTWNRTMTLAMSKSCPAQAYKTARMLNVNWSAREGLEEVVTGRTQRDE